MWLWFAPSQEHEGNAAAKTQPGIKLSIGMDVIFKTSQIPAINLERNAESTIRPPLVIDGIAGNRVSIRSRHKKRRAWVTLDQLISFDHAIDEINAEITKHPRDPNLYARRAQLWAGHDDDGLLRGPIWMRPFGLAARSPG